MSSHMVSSETEDCSGRMPKPKINIEHTFAMVKPEAIHHADEIEDIILKSGFTIINVSYDYYRQANTLTVSFVNRSV